MEKRKLKDVGKFILSVLVCQLAGFIGSLFTTPHIPTWYANLTKPSFTPPNAVFAPVWTTLYFLMGLSLFLVWKKGTKGLTLFFIQLVLNVVWSILFFGLKSPLLGFIDIIVLWLLILLTIINFFKISKFAGILLLPYILWVSYASVLNFSIWRLN